VLAVVEAAAMPINLS